MVVRRRLGPQRLRTTTKRGLRAAGNVDEMVVRGGPGLFVPPVTADESVVSIGHTGVSQGAIHRRSKAKPSDRRGAVTLVLVRRKTVVTNPGVVRSQHQAKATVFAFKQFQRGSLG